jgi:biotin transporter BioY
MAEDHLFSALSFGAVYLWIAYAFVAGFIARSKRRDPLLYFVASLVLSPLVAIPLVIGLTDRRQG